MGEQLCKFSSEMGSGGHCRALPFLLRALWLHIMEWEKGDHCQCGNRVGTGERDGKSLVMGRKGQLLQL